MFNNEVKSSIFNEAVVKPKEVMEKMDELELNVYFFECHLEDLKETVKYYQREVDALTQQLMTNIDDIYEYDEQTGEPYFSRDVIKDFINELTRGIDLVEEAQRELDECKREYVEFMSELENWLKERVGMEE